MEKQEFSEIIKKYSEEIEIKLQEEQIDKFYTYMEIEKVLNPNNNNALQKFKSERYKDKYND